MTAPVTTSAGVDDQPLADFDVEDQGEQLDPEAPYGRRVDGAPRAKPGRRAKGTPKPTKTPPPPPRKATSGRKPPPRTPKGPDYRPGLVSLLSLPVGLLGAAGASLNRPELVADAAVLASGAPGLAEGLHQLATDEPRVAAVLDWVMSAGPYGALMSALVPMAAQIACNHGLIRAGMLGTRDPAELLDAFVARQAHPNGTNGAGRDFPQG